MLIEKWVLIQGTSDFGEGKPPNPIDEEVKLKILGRTYIGELWVAIYTNDLLWTMENVM